MATVARACPSQERGFWGSFFIATLKSRNASTYFFALKAAIAGALKSATFFFVFVFVFGFAFSFDGFGVTPGDTFDVTFDGTVAETFPDAVAPRTSIANSDASKKSISARLKGRIFRDAKFIISLVNRIFGLSNNSSVTNHQRSNRDRRSRRSLGLSFSVSLSRES